MAKTMAREIWRVSASQIKTWNDCPRKWGFKYIDGLEDPPSKAAILGSKVHAELERYLGGGDIDEASDAGKIAATALDLLPEPREDLSVEEEVVFELDGVTFRGFVDLIDPAGPTIFDHKTSSDPKRWGLTEETLVDDVQALMYATAGFLRWDLDSVGLQWTYLKTRGTAMATAVRATLSKDETLEKFRTRIHPTALAIVEAADCAESALELSAKPSGCSKFGGCPFSGVCPRTEDQLLESSLGTKTGKETDTMTLKDLLKAKNGKKAPPRKNELAQILPPEAKEEKKTDATSDEETALKGQEAILDFIKAAGGTATFSKSRANATREVPFAHGGSLYALGKESKITILDEKKTRVCSLATPVADLSVVEVIREEAPTEETPTVEVVEEPPTRSILEEARASNRPEYADDRRELFLAMARAGEDPSKIEKILDLFDAKIVSWSRG